METTKPDHEPVQYDPAKTPAENVRDALDAPVIPEDSQPT
jgi:hypothetical protein